MQIFQRKAKNPQNWQFFDQKTPNWVTIFAANVGALYTEIAPSQNFNFLTKNGMSSLKRSILLIWDHFFSLFLMGHNIIQKSDWLDKWLYFLPKILVPNCGHRASTFFADFSAWYLDSIKAKLGLKMNVRAEIGPSLWILTNI